MENEMKMSDVFYSELAEVPHNPNFEPFDIKYYSYGELKECNAEQESAVQHAVLTHDQHVARIKELEEALSNLVKYASEAGDTIHYEYGIGEYIQDESITAAEKLLEQK